GFIAFSHELHEDRLRGLAGIVAVRLEQKGVFLVVEFENAENPAVMGHTVLARERDRPVLCRIWRHTSLAPLEQSRQSTIPAHGDELRCREGKSKCPVKRPRHWPPLQAS